MIGYTHYICRFRALSFVAALRKKARISLAAESRAIFFVSRRRSVLMTTQHFLPYLRSQVLVKHVLQVAIAVYFRLFIVARGTTDVPGQTLDACGVQTPRIMTQTRSLVTAVEQVHQFLV